MNRGDARRDAGDLRDLDDAVRAALGGPCRAGDHDRVRERLAVAEDAELLRLRFREHQRARVVAVGRVDLHPLAAGSGDREQHHRRAACLHFERAGLRGFDAPDRVALDLPAEDAEDGRVRRFDGERTNAHAGERRAVIVDDGAGDGGGCSGGDGESEDAGGESLHVGSLDAIQSANVACPWSWATSAGVLPSLPRGSRCAP